MTNLIQIDSIFGSSELQHMVQILVYEGKKKKKGFLLASVKNITYFPWPLSLCELNHVALVA